MGPTEQQGRCHAPQLLRLLCVLLLLLLAGARPAAGAEPIVGPALLAPRPRHKHHEIHGTGAAPPREIPSPQPGSDADSRDRPPGRDHANASPAVVHVLEAVAFTSSMALNLSPMCVCLLCLFAALFLC